MCDFAYLNIKMNGSLNQKVIINEQSLKMSD